MRHPVVIAATALLGLVASTTVAFADVTERWVAVDAVASGVQNTGFSGVTLSLTGVKEGAAAAEQTSYAVASSSENGMAVIERCERLALLSLSRPGRYALDVVRLDGGPNNGSYTLRSCRLVRVD